MTVVNEPQRDRVLMSASLNGDDGWASNELPASALESELGMKRGDEL